MPRLNLHLILVVDAKAWFGSKGIQRCVSFHNEMKLTILCDIIFKLLIKQTQASLPANL